MRTTLSALTVAALLAVPAAADELVDSVKADYDAYLAGLRDHFHRNPELSTAEFRTAERMAAELRSAGLEVTEGIGGAALPSHHSPLFRIEPESSVRTGVESTVVALLELMAP